MSALNTQIDGDHYKDMKIQPMEYSMENGLDACQHTIIKYVSRFRSKGGIQDLEKAKHCIDMLIEFERKKEPPIHVFESDGWIEWNGGDCPVLPGQRVNVRLRNGYFETYNACNLRWNHSVSDNEHDIIAYRAANEA